MSLSDNQSNPLPRASCTESSNKRNLPSGVLAVSAGQVTNSGDAGVGWIGRWDFDLDGNLNTDGDFDGDRVGDSVDAYPLVSLSGLTDSDGDGVPNDCQEIEPSPCDDTEMTSDLDDDNDGLTDIEENDLGTDPTNSDTDSDGVGDNGDNCPSVSNSAQTNNDGDEAGDACDPDDDNDGLTDDQELSLGTNPLLKDTDGDGWSDSEEVGEGTDPLAPTSQPELPSGLPVWLLYEATQFN